MHFDASDAFAIIKNTNFMEFYEEKNPKFKSIFMKMFQII